VLRALVKEDTEKLTEPLALTLWEAGKILRFVGPDAVIVPELFELRTTVPVLPPFFRMEKEEGSTISLQPPDPDPVTGGPGVPVAVLSQSSVLLWDLSPLLTVFEAMPAVVLTVAKLTLGRTLTSPLIVTSPASETSTQEGTNPLVFWKAKVFVQAWVRPRQLNVIEGKGDPGGIWTPDSRKKVFV
jgi:hypothetical protein